MLHAILAPKPAWRGLQTQRINGPARLCPWQHPQPSCIPPAEDPIPCAVCSPGSSLFEGAAGRLLPFLWSEEGGLEDEGPGPMGSWGSPATRRRLLWVPLRPLVHKDSGLPALRISGNWLPEPPGWWPRTHAPRGRVLPPTLSLGSAPQPHCSVLRGRVLRGRNRARKAQTEEAAPCRW